MPVAAAPDNIMVMAFRNRIPERSDGSFRQLCHLTMLSMPPCRCQNGAPLRCQSVIWPFEVSCEEKTSASDGLADFVGDDGLL